MRSSSVVLEGRQEQDEGEKMEHQLQPRWPENVFQEEQAKMAEVLLRGRDFTFQLKDILQNPPLLSSNFNSSAEQLLNNILLSFTDTISILTSSSSSSGDEVSQQKASTSPSPISSPKRVDDSCDSFRSSSSLTKERRGCYKRRKTSQTWTRTTPTLVDDGFAWRKYGQKVILNSKHPRNYYRCTHKFDQGCMATKQVQKTDTDPPMHQVTYSGNHSCNSLLRSPQIFIDSEPPPSSTSGSILLSFNHKSDQNAFFTTHTSFNDTPHSGAILNQSSTDQDRYLQFASSLCHDDVLSGLTSGTASNQGSSEMDILVSHADFFDDMFDF